MTETQSSKPEKSEVIALPKQTQDITVVPEPYRGLYLKTAPDPNNPDPNNPDPKSVYTLEGHNVAGLRSKNAELLSELKTERGKTSQLTADLDQLKNQQTPPDVKAVEAEWKGKYNALSSESAAKLETANQRIKHLTVDATASKIASKIAVKGSESLLIPHIASRLAVGTSLGSTPDSGLGVVVLDSQGVESSLTLDDLERDISRDSRFAAIIAGSRSKGGGQQPGTGATTSTGQTISKAEWMALTPKQKHEAVVTKKLKITG